MTKSILYTLATLCYAASVGCLACWGWLAFSGSSIMIYVDVVASTSIMVELQGHSIATMTFPGRPLMPPIAWEVERGDPYFWNLPVLIKRHGAFGVAGPLTFFPIWHPALTFALASVGVLRFRRQFSIRSALICVGVVALLLGMVVAL